MDPVLKERIEKLAQYVAQSNDAMEQTVRERQRTNPSFAFLFGGEGSSYYLEMKRNTRRSSRRRTRMAVATAATEAAEVADTALPQWAGLESRAAALAEAAPAA